MGANTQRVPEILVTNATAANTGHDVTTAVPDDLILFDRAYHEVADGTTVQNSADAGHLYVYLGGATGPRISSIQTRNIRNVRVTPYVAPVPYSAAIASINAVNNTDYLLKIIYRDEYPTAPGHSAPRSYAYTSDGSATAAEIANGFVATINADPGSQVTASFDGSALQLVGKTIGRNNIDIYERVTFDVALPMGFQGATITYTTGTSGSGIGQKIKDMEQATRYVQRRLWPIPPDTTKAVVGAKYNVVTIEYYDEHFGDLANQYKAPLKSVIAFAAVTDGTTGAVTASPKQTAFMTKLTSVVESAGVFVS